MIEKLTYIFSTRELAIGLLAIVFILWLVSSKKLRPSVSALIKASLSKYLIISFILLVLYSICLIFPLSKLSFWKWLYLKDIIIWILFVGVPVSFNAFSIKPDVKYFKKIVIDNLKYTALVEYVINIFTFNIIVEIILQLILIILFMFIAFTEKKEEYRLVNLFFNGILVIVSILLLYYTIKQGIKHYKELEVIDELVCAFTPIVMSVLYIPLIYLFSLISLYQSTMYRIRDALHNNRPTVKHFYWKVIKSCKASANKINVLKYFLFPYLKESMTNEDIDLTMNEFETHYARIRGKNNG